jgi:hypothetical protein
MSPKKSMKSINTQSDNQDNFKNKNMFDALILEDSDNSEKLSNDNIEPQINTEKSQNIKFDKKILQNQSILMTDNNSTNNTMLNISNNINIADFISDNRNKHKSNNKFKDIKYDEKMIDCKKIYDENVDYGDIGNELKLNSHWTTWEHRFDNQDWTLHGYQKRYIINSIGSFWRYFNHFQFYDNYKNQLFIMRGEIAPIWEDVNNKFGGICSIKIDSTQRGFKTDISTEIFVSICMLIMNETFPYVEDITGISYNVKKKNILVKIWTKTFHPDNKFISELPKTLINKFNSELQKQLMNIFGPDYKMSIQYKQIKPEYNL